MRPNDKYMITKRWNREGDTKKIHRFFEGLCVGRCMSVERTSSADFFQVEEVRTKLVNPDDLVFVGKLSQFQWAPGHGPDDGIRLLEVRVVDRHCGPSRK